MSSLETVSFAVRSAVQHFNWTEAQLFATGKVRLLYWNEHLNDVVQYIYIGIVSTEMRHKHYKFVSLISLYGKGIHMLLL